VVTNDDGIASRVRALRHHAQSRQHYHDELGFNYRMDAFQGAVLSIKLKYLEAWVARRRALAARYQKLLADTDLHLPVEAPARRHVWHLFVVLHRERDHIRQHLQERDIEVSMHYPVPVHLQKAYRFLRYRVGDFPVTEGVARECMSLPLYAEMTEEQQDLVVDALHEALREVRH